jgi:hypothetical protein
MKQRRLQILRMTIRRGGCVIRRKVINTVVNDLTRYRHQVEQEEGAERVWFTYMEL